MFSGKRRVFRILLLAFMLGISNIFLQETRMINDCAIQLEQDMEDTDDEPFGEGEFKKY